jgi:hypothetical protein
VPRLDPDTFADPFGCDRAALDIDAPEHRVTDEVIKRLANDPEVFVRGTSLVKVLRDAPNKDGVDRQPGSPVISELPLANLRDRISAVSNFKQLTAKDKWESAHPPRWLVEAVDARGEWPGLPYLDGISDTPVLRADGSVWQECGWDSRTNVLFDSAIDFPRIPDVVTREMAVEAMKQVMAPAANR